MSKFWKVALCLSLLTLPAVGQATSYLGFDRNDYPGDDLLPALRKSFAYSSYWLNNPPGETSNSWIGKRSSLVKNGFGFLILFNGRADSELKKQDPATLGKADGIAATTAARKEGFPLEATIFLDQEEGGRLLPEQMTYLQAWIKAVRQSRYRPGIYCSGISVPDGPGKTISTAEQLHQQDPTLALWVVNDNCPPAPGCTTPKPLPSPAKSGSPYAVVWQFAQSPRRLQFTAACAKTYAPENQCYAPGIAHSQNTFLDLNVAHSPDPSHGR